MAIPQPSLEPAHSIFRPRWHEARARLSLLKSHEREIFFRLLAHVERGWSDGVGELQAIYERHSHLEADDTPTADFLAFIEGDVVDVYLTMASDAADLVPGWPGWMESADPGDMDGEAFLFARYVGVLRLAAQSPELEPEVVAGVETACSALAGWYDELAEILRVIDKEVLRPRLPPEEYAIMLGAA